MEYRMVDTKTPKFMAKFLKSDGWFWLPYTFGA